MSLTKEVRLLTREINKKKGTIILPRWGGVLKGITLMVRRVSAHNRRLRPARAFLQYPPLSGTPKTHPPPPHPSGHSNPPLSGTLNPTLCSTQPTPCQTVINFCAIPQVMAISTPHH